jgi:maltose/moltooligosaccharide transporter
VSTVYKVGTLAYTRASLVVLLFYLLWGDFCFSLMEAVMPTLLPIRLAQLHAPNWTVGLIITAIPNLMTLLVNPVVSFRSDRFRSRWGRRIPFLAVASPFVVVFLILLGMSEPISHALQQFVLAGKFSPLTVLLVVICVLMVLFQIFNAVIQSIYYYLFNDVVPPEMLARTMTIFRMVGSLAGSLYSWFVFPYSENHLGAIFIGAGLIYLIGFGMMCVGVKEGDYPPPPENVGNQRGVLAAVETYAAECFTHRFYWFIFLANACWAMTWATAPFSRPAALQYLGVDLTYIGHLGAFTGIAGLILLFPGGILADRYHPLRIMLLGLFLVLCIDPLWIAFYFCRHSLSLETIQTINTALSVVSVPLTTLASAGEIALFMLILPKERYGQFCSANALVRSLALIVGGVLCGVLLDSAKSLTSSPDDCYRFVPVWNFVFRFGQVFFYYLVYREWKKLGGMNGFTPPNAAAPRYLLQFFAQFRGSTEKSP